MKEDPKTVGRPDAPTGGVLEALPVPVALLACGDLRYIYANDAFLGLAPTADVVGRTNAELWPVWADSLDRAAREARDSGPWASVEVLLDGAAARTHMAVEFRLGWLGTPEGPVVIVVAEPRPVVSRSGRRVRPAEPRFESALTLSGSGGVLAVSGALDTASAPDFERALRDALEACPGPLVVDLSGVPYMESLAFGSLIAAAGRAGHGRLAVACSRPEIVHLFDVAGLGEALNVASSVAEARELAAG